MKLQQIFQALDEMSLRLFNRDHSVKEALHCIGVAKQLFPGRVSMDVIFGRPNQTTERLAKYYGNIFLWKLAYVSLNLTKFFSSTRIITLLCWISTH